MKQDFNAAIVGIAVSSDIARPAFDDQPGDGSRYICGLRTTNDARELNLERGLHASRQSVGQTVDGKISVANWNFMRR